MPDDPPGERYRIVRPLGSGGMATVSLAHDTTLDRPVAIKRLHAFSADETTRRFMREARIGASLRHPNVVTVHDVIASDDDVLIVMEYVEGETLAAALERGPLPPGRAIAVLRDVAAALDAAHADGVVHRDVKPANVLIRIDGRAKLADLGIAAAAEMTRITREGALLGTLNYMAPE